MQLKDSSAIVTGSSSGIGAAIAIALAEQGCNVAITYSRNSSGAEKVAEQCQAYGVKTLIKKANVANKEDCQSLVDDTVAACGKLNILINNAGTTKFCEHSNLDGLDKDDFLNLYEVNTVGAFQMVQSAAPIMRNEPVAHIINMASIAAVTGVGSSIAYAASKGAMLTMTMSLARVLGPQIRINAICPGFVQGEWLAEGLGQETYDKTLAGVRRIAPLNDTATPERIAETAIGVISGMDWTTGESIIIDGGTHLHTAPLRK
ncbi:SDR family NAD(P)-dependent oxidoreductase [Aurantivibrio plasticivorans]